MEKVSLHHPQKSVRTSDSLVEMLHCNVNMLRKREHRLREENERLRVCPNCAVI